MHFTEHFLQMISDRAKLHPGTKFSVLQVKPAFRAGYWVAFVLVDGDTEIKQVEFKAS